MRRSLASWSTTVGKALVGSYSTRSARRAALARVKATLLRSLLAPLPALPPVLPKEPVLLWIDSDGEGEAAVVARADLSFSAGGTSVHLGPIQRLASERLPVLPLSPLPLFPLVTGRCEVSTPRPPAAPLERLVEALDESLRAAEAAGNTRRGRRLRRRVDQLLGALERRQQEGC